jgi:hypothetical protein
VQIELILREKILIRGGIAVGALVKSWGLVYGSALVKAYELEKTAKHPRVFIEDGLLDILQPREALTILKLPSLSQWIVIILTWIISAIAAVWLIGMNKLNSSESINKSSRKGWRGFRRIPTFVRSIAGLSVTTTQEYL